MAERIGTINDVIRSLTEAPQLIRERTRVWFEQSQKTGQSWYLEMVFPPKPFAFVVKCRLEKFFEKVTRAAVRKGFLCYFKYSRVIDFTGTDDWLAVEVHIVTFGQQNLTDLAVVGPGRVVLTIFTLDQLDSTDVSQVLSA